MKREIRFSWDLIGCVRNVKLIFYLGVLFLNLLTCIFCSTLLNVFFCFFHLWRWNIRHYLSYLPNFHIPEPSVNREFSVVESNVEFGENFGVKTKLCCQQSEITGRLCSIKLRNYFLKKKYSRFS